MLTHAVKKNKTHHIKKKNLQNHVQNPLSLHPKVSNVKKHDTENANLIDTSMIPKKEKKTHNLKKKKRHQHQHSLSFPMASDPKGSHLKQNYSDKSIPVDIINSAVREDKTTAHDKGNKDGDNSLIPSHTPKQDKIYSYVKSFASISKKNNKAKPSTDFNEVENEDKVKNVLMPTRIFLLHQIIIQFKK